QVAADVAMASDLAARSAAAAQCKNVCSALTETEMATEDEYAAVEKVLLKAMLNEEAAELKKLNPMVVGMVRNMVPPDAAPKAAHAAARIAVDTLDQYRASKAGAK